jgi:TBC1 domain family member 10B
MFANWDEFVTKRWKKLRDRCRKGIPISLRGRAWFYLCAGHKQQKRNPNLFESLDKQEGNEKINDEIRKDLNRQFPSHEMFATENGSGQEDLFRILKAFSIIKPDIGYCQGQAPLASVLLMHMPAEDAFWCLIQICDHYATGYFSPGLEAIQLHGCMLSSFIKRFQPSIYRLLKKQQIDPVLYMTEWFMCFFSRTLPWPCVLRIWDMFFCEGIVIIFKVAIILILSVLSQNEDRKKCISIYETLFTLRNIPIKFKSETYLINRVINFDLTEKDLKKEAKQQSIRRYKEKEKLVKEKKVNQRLK